MLTSIFVASAGIYLLKDLGLVKLFVKSTVLGTTIISGLITGLGWGFFGYCPGTSMGAIGEGRWDGLWGLLGMLAGAAVYADAYPLMKRTVLTWGDLGKITLPGILGISHWIVVPVFVLAGVGLFYWFEKKNL